ncbi:TPA: helix-turn-helix domain containing protein [Streptococcus pneumoniae]|uniref:helix-turn-helix domain-containing protein n=1 Tax=Streptococcus pneumoniae TaxID=1313 RepID=UPI00062CD34B|nr:helix-turn-helix domain containing protein [Streptococcus pneumoniae]VTQ35944.1 Uncharacterised protein [Haemophilus haemolyticus]MBW8111086.1 helix-turn-helix domain containing protein [Streptococcus pneumoniae]MDY6773216.1 helix-turn-helix domain containing protein [Streptococcus pneumoniae]OBX92709.1 hypothetical protein AX278_09485 [Streptococcus pneumoniae]CRI61481.1 Mobile element protein [Streptococcus pneumoniae]
MKLSYEDKVQIYELRKQGQSFKQLSKRFGVDVSGLKYMVKLIDRYGIEIVKKERLARKQRISFKANLKALKQWNSATQM